MQHCEPKTFFNYGFECKGLFATRDLDPGTIVFNDEGLVFDYTDLTRQEMLDHPKSDILIRHCCMFGHDRYASSEYPEKNPIWYLNHSCDPNIWLEENGEFIKYITKRYIKKGEQLCSDYAMTDSEGSFNYGLKCQCKSEKCRGILTFGEYRSRALMKENYGHVSGYIWKLHMENSWYDPRLGLAHKTDKTLGLFVRNNLSENNLTNALIKKNEIVVVFAGKIMHEEQFNEAGGITKKSLELSLQVHQKLWKVPVWQGKDKEDQLETSDFIKHSCNPSCGMLDSVTVITIRDIVPGDEITLDFSKIITGQRRDYECNCGAINCRKNITSVD